MSRQVDVKALVSHIVRGDGLDKCRICMGDTSEGQVHLSDTVMTDGDKPVTLSELLETITGVEVNTCEVMPRGVCRPCADAAEATARFRMLCVNASAHWHNVVQLLDTLPSAVQGYRNTLFVIIQDKHMTILHDSDDSHQSDSDVEMKDLLPKVRVKRMKKVVQSCQCPDCGKKFQFPKDLCEHLKESTNLKRACCVCASIVQKEYLTSHLKTEHDIDSFNCKKCFATFQSVRQYKRHLYKAHSAGSNYCGECGRSFRSAYAYYGHKSSHDAKTCPGCNELFRNHRCYVYHVKRCCNLDASRNDTYRTKNRVLFEVQNRKSERKVKVGARGSSDTRCVCDYCGKEFAGKKFVCAHIQIVHLKNTHRPCHYCGKSLAAAHMTEHIKRHELVTSFHCEHCGVVLKTKLGYTQHKRLHTGEKPYRCKYCSETFSASSRRSEHVRRVHRNPPDLKYGCELCPAKFRLPYRLKRHLSLAHGGDKGKMEFECSKCRVKFGTYRGLLCHSRKHSVCDSKSILQADVTSEVHSFTSD